MSKIYDVVVEGISLVTSAFTPAVPHATTKHAIFKTRKKISEEEEEEKERLDMCQKSLKEIISKCHRK